MNKKLINGAIALSSALALMLSGCATVAAKPEEPAAEETQAPAVIEETAAPAQAETEPAASAESGSGEATAEITMPEGYEAVLNGEETFYSVDTGADMLLADYLTDSGEYLVSFTLSRMAAVDLDADGADEAVLELSVDGSAEIYLILHELDGAIYGYSVPYRGMVELKQDGSFSYSSGAGDTGYGRMRFDAEGYQTAALAEMTFDTQSGEFVYTLDGEEVAEDAFTAFVAEQDAKADAVWGTNALPEA